MYSRRLRTTITFVLVLLLSFMSVLEVTAASLKATIVANEHTVDGKQKISVNSVVDVTYADLQVLQDVTFSLFKGESQIESQVKLKSDAEIVTVALSVYSSLKFTNISFEGLEAGAEYTLQAEYDGVAGRMITPQQTILVPSSTGLNITVERITKDSDTYEVSTAGEIRSDDKNVRLTILNDGVLQTNKQIRISSYYGATSYVTTDAVGQIQLKDISNFSINYAILFVEINNDTDQYEIAPIYVTDLQQAGTYTVAIGYLNAQGKISKQPTDYYNSPNGLVNRLGRAGLDVLVLRTGTITDDFTTFIRSDNGEAYMFQTSQAALFSSVDGSHINIVQDSREYSRLSFQYTWNGNPVSITSYSIIANNQYKQINMSSVYEKLQATSIYVKKNVEYEITAIGIVPGEKSKIVFRNTVKPTEPTVSIQNAASANGFSALKLQLPDNGQGSGQLQISYLNDKYNYSQISTAIPAVDATVYVQKGEEIHRLTATAAHDNTVTDNYSLNQVVLKSYFSPTDSEYLLKAGSTYNSQIIIKALGSNYYEQAETRNQIVLGENIEYRMLMTDENGNSLDVNNNYKTRILDESGAKIEEEGLSWTTEEIEGSLQRVDKRQWKPVKSGTYKIQWFSTKYDSTSGQYVDVAVLSEAVLKVLPKQELDIEVKGKDGTLVDLVNKPYLTVNQADGITLTVRQHVTGAQGELLSGVEVRGYGEVIGTTDAQGRLTIPEDYKYTVGQLSFKKADYLSKTISVAILNPEFQSIVRVRGLDKPEGESYAGGVPLDYAYIQAVIKKADGSYEHQTQFIDTDDQQAFLVVESPSVVGVDFIRYNRSYLGVESKYGYYMYGSIRTEPGKEYSLVLDARQPLQQVSKVKLTKYMEELSIVRKELAGTEYVPYVIDSNDQDENYFYATQGTYSVLAHTTGNTFVYRDDVVIGEGDNTLEIDDSASGLATLIAPESGSIYTIEYTTPNKSKLEGYAYDANAVQLTPGEVTVNVDQSMGGIEYEYNIHFAPGTLKAGTITQLAPQAIQGLDIIGLQDGKLVRPAGQNWLQIGLIDTAGNSIGQIKKPQILVTNRGWSRGYKNIAPEAASYEIQDEAGNKLYGETSLSYPLRAYTYNNNTFSYFSNGTYVIKATVTIDGQTYTLDKKFVLENATETVVDPGQDIPGTDMDNPPVVQPGNGTGANTGTGAGSGSVTPAPTPTSAPASSTNASVDEQNTKLQELLKDVTGTASERATAAQSALTSIAESLKSVATSKEAEENSKSISQALDSASQLLTSIQDPIEKQKIVDSISELVGNAPYLINKFDSSDKAIEFAQALIQNAAAVMNNAQGIATDALQLLKQSVISSSQAALNKAGEVTIAKEDVTVEGNTVTSQLSEGLISKQIESTKLALAAVSDDLTSKLGAGTADDLKLTLTVKVPSSGGGVNKLNTALSAEVLTLVKENGIAGLKLQMDQTAFTIEPDTFGIVTPGQKINLAAEVVENAVVNKPSQAEPLATIPVMEFSATVGDQKVSSFAKPINVTFDVSSIDTSKYTEANLENLTVYVLNDKSLTWEAVGGKYDPITQTVSALRGHFSRYTVMLGTAAFSDVLSSHWAVKEINYLLAKGIVDQTGEFHPSDKITRQQFAAWIARAYGLDGSNLTLPFKDISAKSAYYDEIAAAYAAGIVSGKSATTFDPEATITREEIATMLARALTTYNGVKAVSQPAIVNATFTDGAKISKWAAANVALTKSRHLFEGFEDNTFRPTLTASKAEAAALIYRLYQLK